MARDYKVGFGRPPQEHQFKPGQSGNPRGRPKGTKNYKTDLVEELQEQVLVTEGGRKQKLSKQRAMIKSLVARAVNGDPRAATAVIGELHRLALAKAGEGDTEPLNSDDQMILDLFLAGRQPKGDPKP